MAGKKLKEIVEIYEALVIQNTLERHHDNITDTAKELGLTRQGLWSKIKRFGLRD